MVLNGVIDMLKRVVACGPPIGSDAPWGASHVIPLEGYAVHAQKAEYVGKANDSCHAKPTSARKAGAAQGRVAGANSASPNASSSNFLHLGEETGSCSPLQSAGSSISSIGSSTSDMHPSSPCSSASRASSDSCPEIQPFCSSEEHGSHSTAAAGHDADPLMGQSSSPCSATQRRKSRVVLSWQVMDGTSPTKAKPLSDVIPHPNAADWFVNLLHKQQRQHQSQDLHPQPECWTNCQCYELPPGVLLRYAGCDVPLSELSRLRRPISKYMARHNGEVPAVKVVEQVVPY